MPDVETPGARAIFELRDGPLDELGVLPQREHVERLLEPHADVLDAEERPRDEERGGHRRDVGRRPQDERQRVQPDDEEARRVPRVARRDRRAHDRSPPLRLLRGIGFGLAGLPFWCRSKLGIRSIVGLALRNVLRRPVRSLAVVLMVALAEFLVVFISGFELVESVSWGETDSPTGGWTYIAQFAFPTSVDPSITATHYQLNVSDRDSDLLGGSTVALLRASEGDDANCTSLFATKNR